jgi:hypothetical protein
LLNGAGAWPAPLRNGFGISLPGGAGVGGILGGILGGVIGGEGATCASYGISSPAIAGCPQCTSRHAEPLEGHSRQHVAL